jgi:hypothetical protein
MKNSYQYFQRLKNCNKGNYGTATGQFKPSHPEKYAGTFPITFRSSWELKVMQFFDINQSVVKWGSESCVIPYIDPTRENSEHRYFVDFNMTIRQKDGTLQQFMVEVKPSAQCVMPRKTAKSNPEAYKTRLETYMRNMAKWKFANAAAAKRGMKFLIITEKNLFPHEHK